MYLSWLFLRRFFTWNKVSSPNTLKFQVVQSKIYFRKSDEFIQPGTNGERHRAKNKIVIGKYFLWANESYNITCIIYIVYCTYLCIQYHEILAQFLLFILLCLLYNFKKKNKAQKKIHLQQKFKYTWNALTWSVFCFRFVLVFAALLSQLLFQNNRIINIYWIQKKIIPKMGVSSCVTSTDVMEPKRREKKSVCLSFALWFAFVKGSKYELCVTILMAICYILEKHLSFSCCLSPSRFQC